MRVRLRRLTAMMLLGVGAIACKPDIPKGVFACEQGADCPEGQRCAIDLDGDGNRCVAIDDPAAESCDGTFELPGYEGTPDWTSLDLTLCEIDCPDHSPACIKNDCASYSAELGECTSAVLFECATSATCNEDWIAFGCCRRANCDSVDGNEGLVCSQTYCDEVLTSATECVYDHTRCVAQAWTYCSSLAPGKTPSDAGVRLDGGVDAGLRLDATVPRDAALDAARTDAALVPAKDAAAPRPDAATPPADAGMSLPDAAPAGQ